MNEYAISWRRKLPFLQAQEGLEIIQAETATAALTRFQIEVVNAGTSLGMSVLEIKKI